MKKKKQMRKWKLNISRMGFKSLNNMDKTTMEHQSNSNTKNEYFYLKYLNFQTIMVFLNIYFGCYEQLSLYLVIYD